MADEDDGMRGALAEEDGDEGEQLFNLTSTGATHEVGGGHQLDEGGYTDDGEMGGSSITASGSPLGKSGAGPQGLRPSRSSKQFATNKFEAVVKDSSSKARVQVDEGDEEHWNLVIKKLAPQGYNKTPVWQKRILERVIKRMTTRGPEAEPKPLTEKHAMSAAELAISAVTPDAMWPLKTQLPPRRESSASAKAATAAQAALRKRLLGRQNKVHFYTRAIQMEQLLGQDLETDLRHMQQEIGLTLRESRGGEMRAAEELTRIARKEKAVANRLQVLVEKANALEASNSQLISAIDDLRSEQALVQAQVKRMQEKDFKMDEDMQFLSIAAHSALDQREKVKQKLMQTQRDSAFDKSHKLSQLAELIQRADSLDLEYTGKLAAIDEHEQMRKRRVYNLGKQRRLAQLQAETRNGFLQSQVVGWDSEFGRLQEFTGMDKRFQPGDDQTIEEITSRYLSKDQQNTSLLRYLHAQQVEVNSLETELKGSQGTSKQLEKQLQHAIESDSAPVLDFDGLAQKEAEAAYRIEAQLSDLCERIAAISDGLLTKAASEAPRPPPISVATLEEHLMLHEDVSAKLHAEWRQKYISSKVKTQELLHQWVQPKVARAFETIDEIHERLVITAQNAVQLGDDDDDEHERRAEKHGVSPFARRKVNKARERAQIQEWARRRQPAPGQLAYTQPVALPSPLVRTIEGGLGQTLPESSAGAARKPGSAPGQGANRPKSKGAEGTMVYKIGQRAAV